MRSDGKYLLSMVNEATEEWWHTMAGPAMAMVRHSGRAIDQPEQFNQAQRAGSNGNSQRFVSSAAMRYAGSAKSEETLAQMTQFPSP